jgi:hypothetical protein
MMQITLRKAHALQLTISDAIKGNKILSAVRITEFESVNDVVDAGTQLFVKNLKTQEELIKTLFTIRALLSEANASSGVNVLLCDLALQEQLIKCYKPFAQTEVMGDRAVLQRKLDKVENSTEQSWDRSSSSIDSSVITSAMSLQLEVAWFNARQAKESVANSLLAINVTQSIKLDDDTVNILKKYMLM